MIPPMPLLTFFPNPIWADLAVAADPAETGPLILAAVLLSLVVIYLASKVGGEICTRINFPAVLGELVGGVVVGVSVLHLLVFSEGGAIEPSVITNLLQQTAGMNPDLTGLISQTSSEVISVMSEIGVIILLFEIGLESDLPGLLQAGLQAAVVAVVGVAVPFIAGTVGLIYFFHIDTVPAIFAGAALTATSIGITAKVLAEIQRLNTPEGQIIIGAAVLDDILGIIVLAVVASLAKTGTVEISNVVYLIISSIVFLVGSVVLGRLLSPYFLGLVDRLGTRGSLLIPSLIFAFALGYVAVALQLEAILGAFTAGLVLGETERRRELEEQVVPIADMLVPIFFVCVGAKTDISVLNPFVPENRPGLIIASFLILVGILGKVVTGFTVFGRPGINRLAIGVGMVPRGEVGLIFAAVGAASGVLSKSLDAAIIAMVIITTFVAPPLLRIVFKTSAPATPVLATEEGLAIPADSESKG